MGDACNMLEGIQQQCGTGTKKGRGLSGKDSSVSKLDGTCSQSGLVRSLLCSNRAQAVCRRNARTLHQEGDFVHFVLRCLTVGKIAEGGIVAADYLLEGCLTDHFIVTDAVAYHIYTHVRRGFVGGFAVDVHEDGVHDREYLYVPVVVNGHFAVGFQVEGVDHVHIVKIGRGGFVGKVDGMGEGDVPDGEGLKFGISGLDSALVLLVKLAKANGHFSASGTGGCDNHQRLGGLYIIVTAKTFVRVNQGHILGISGNSIMVVYLYSHILQTLAICHRACLAVEMGYNNAVDA